MAHYQPQDKFFKRAREQGLPSRAAFKLTELLQRYHLLGPRGRVLDLGCAPGGWLAIMAPIAGAQGRLAGIDPAPCRPLPPQVTVLSGDAADEAVRRAAADAIGGRADLITSDMAPKLSGIRARDEARCEELARLALEIAGQMLKPGGAMIVKVFMGQGFQEIIAEFRRRFRAVDIVKTKATRPGSRELYIVARGFRLPAV